MRIQLGLGNGTTEEVFGEIATSRTGLVYSGEHVDVMRERVEEARRMLNVDENRAIVDPAHGPARPEDGLWVQLSDEQVLRLLLHDLSDSWLNWCVEQVDEADDPDESDPDPSADAADYNPNRSDLSGRPPLPKFIGTGRYRVPVPPHYIRFYPKGLVDDCTIETEEWEPEPDEDEEDDDTDDRSDVPNEADDKPALVFRPKASTPTRKSRTRKSRPRSTRSGPTTAHHPPKSGGSHTASSCTQNPRRTSGAALRPSQTRCSDRQAASTTRRTRMGVLGSKGEPQPSQRVIASSTWIISGTAPPAATCVKHALHTTHTVCTAGQVE
jgi:hypothetical protein